MTNPWETCLKMQQSMLEGMAAMTRSSMEGYLRFLEQQQRIFARSFGQRRAEDGKPSPKVVPDGPDLKDRYGRRAHDIDVERDV